MISDSDVIELTVTCTTALPESCGYMDLDNTRIANIPAGFHLTEEKVYKILLNYNLKGTCLTVEEVDALFPREE